MAFPGSLSTARFLEIVWEESAVATEIPYLNFSSILYSISEKKKSREKKDSFQKENFQLCSSRNNPNSGLKWANIDLVDYRVI